MAKSETRNKRLEIVFLTVFSAVVLVLFYSLLSSNGLVLGNDPAIHLQRAEMFLQSGKISISEVAWYPPLYHIVLATFIAFTGASSIGETIVLMKAVTVLVDWLVIFSIYIVASRFFGKKTGLLASVILLFCFPLYELNFFGGYTSVVALAFMALLFMFLALPMKGLGHTLVTFILAFSVVLSHQLATFVAVFILPPFILVVLLKSRDRSLALLAAVLGGAIAFAVYYLYPVLLYLGSFVSIIFFQVKTMVYQIPAVNFRAFALNFGFIVVFAFAGLGTACWKLKAKRSLVFFLLLCLALGVPLFFSQSYLVGFLLPFQWFNYYMLPALVILAAVTFSLIVDLAVKGYRNNRKGWRKVTLKAFSLAAIVLLATVLVLRFDTVASKVEESTVYYSMSDLNAYDAGTWLQSHFKDNKTVVVSERPGSWFGVYSGKTVIAETDPVIDRNNVAETVLDLAYEMEHPLTMVRVYSVRGNISDENFVLLNGVWRRIALAPEYNSYLSFNNSRGENHAFLLSELDRQVIFDSANHKFSVQYSGDGFVLVEDLVISNDFYPVSISWRFTPNLPIDNATLFISEYFELALTFKKALIPGVLNWESPWNKPTKVQEGEWAYTDFWNNTLLSYSSVGVYDEKHGIVYTVKFVDVPIYGMVGALASGQIDAMRFQYDFDKIDVNETVTRTYQVLAFSQSSNGIQNNLAQVDELFNSKVSAFDVKTRDYSAVIRDLNIGYIVWDAQRFDRTLLRSAHLQLIYSNDKYIICKVKDTT